MFPMCQERSTRQQRFMLWLVLSVRLVLLTGLNHCLISRSMSNHWVVISSLFPDINFCTHGYWRSLRTKRLTRQHVSVARWRQHDQRFHFHKTSYDGLPIKFEAGTGSLDDAVGLGAALIYLNTLDLHAAGLYESALLAMATDALLDIPGCSIIGQAPKRQESCLLILMVSLHRRLLRGLTPVVLPLDRGIISLNPFYADLVWRSPHVLHLQFTKVLKMQSVWFLDYIKFAQGDIHKKPKLELILALYFTFSEIREKKIIKYNNNNSL